MSDEHTAGSPGTESDTPNTFEEVRITRADLPLHCPMPGMRLWDSHPKVYLPIEETGRERCPYCGTLYILDTA
ncbi:MAG: zinc-finger domain-containing protein [Gammaproteobacteria bacterium]|nr:zinc-finger domain-containing protein [Gammaproteobacteria bacterium]MYD76167.1 zinc-finger domain-containing protein [Gammaproteobacteria bacterium]MYJ51340.1 zinc-finger domain-containing protein [Gammaproteobacteria bacterium]